ncbi:elongin-A isoform X2 [Lepisosteus oculatus]|uniref:elongin-A isoform X2 n=1 Tax=Lepisosteus oculatus TaxID=7918 RepID=UPI0035F51476
MNWSVHQELFLHPDLPRVRCPVLTEHGKPSRIDSGVQRGCSPCSLLSRDRTCSEAQGDSSVVSVLPRPRPAYLSSCTVALGNSWCAGSGLAHHPGGAAHCWCWRGSPRPLLKTLKRLGELPITVDILVETGVGKAVNSLRKHEHVGETAKSLVAKWKKLVPQAVDRPSSAREGRPHSRGGESGRKRVREPSPEDQHPREEEPEEEEEEREYHTSYSPSPPQHHYSPPHSHSVQGGYQSEGFESPAEEEPPLSPRREIRHSVQTPKPHKDPHRDRSAHGERDRDKDKEHRHGDKPQGRGSGEVKKRSKEADHQGGAKDKPPKQSRPLQPRGPSDPPHKAEREGKSEKRGGVEAKPRDPGQAQDRPKPASRGGAVEEEEEAFEAPTMSFESFLNYDAPPPGKKKKKPPRPPSAAPPKAAAAPSKANGRQRQRPRAPPAPAASPPAPEKRRKVVDVVPTLPDIPLPAIQPNYRPLPSLDLTPLSPQRRKVPVSCDEEDAGFTGRRFNSKMAVYSGSKTAYLPKMMSLFEQCIRVLQNNIDSIDEVGGVPYEILEPVLERCTPEQLYRIEQCNQCFMEESDELWMRHCQRDFRRESPQEYESWREMYLRLHDEREERLRMLTQNISSAHANRPKGRQVKMAFVNSAVKPPRDVRRRQERFGTASSSSASASSSSTCAPARIRPAQSYSSQFSESSAQFSSHSSPPEVPRSSSGGGASAVVGHNASSKPQVKKIAPMMAKTIKAFKNRFSRR